MIVSRRAPSSFDASPYRVMDSFQTEFHFFSKKVLDLVLDQVQGLVFGPGPGPGFSLGQTPGPGPSPGSGHGLGPGLRTWSWIWSLEDRTEYQ